MSETLTGSTGASHVPADTPSAWVARFAPLIAGGEALDLACGSGRHARLLAGRGLAVTAVDRDPDALRRAAGPGIVTMRIDLEAEEAAWPFAEGRFAGIVVTNYLHRPLFPHLWGSLAPDGILVYETFALGNAQFGKPSNPDFLLRPGELLDAFGPGMRVVAFEEGVVELPRPAVVQRLCAVKLREGAAGRPCRLP